MRSLLFIDIETFTAANLEFVSLGHFYSTHVLHIFTCLDREPFHQCADISQRIIILDGKSFFFFCTSEVFVEGIVISSNRNGLTEQFHLQKIDASCTSSETCFNGSAKPKC